MRVRLQGPNVLIAVGLALVAVAGPLFAETIYKSTMPDGRVVYAQKPTPGAAKVETLVTTTTDTGVGGLPPDVRERARSPAQPGQAGSTGKIPGPEMLRAAEQAVREAEARREAGKVPLPGERLGTAGGNSRLTDAYWERQKQLEQAVADAQAEAARLRAAAAGR